MPRIVFFGLLLGFLSWAFVCRSRAEEAVSPAISKAVAGNTEFAVDLYSRLRTTGSGNLFFSPYSISTALAMTYAGAAGDTEKEMAKVLHFTLSQTELHPTMASQRQTLLANPGKGNQFRIANRLWGQDGYTFLPEFLKTTKENYGAELGIVKFSNETEKARVQINDWVAKETEQKILDLIQKGVLSADTRLVLTNAIYFKGTWQIKFDEKTTEDLPFHLSQDKEIQVPMMQQTAKFSWGATEDLQILELPYSDNTLSMIVLLPKKVEGLAQLEASVTNNSLKEWTDGVTQKKVIVSLPRFKMTSEFSLGDTLKTMGMTLAFTNQADFSRMNGDRDLSISAVIHKAFVDVNEEGTEAAAATAVVMTRTKNVQIEEPPPVFKADHPFLFLIKDKKTNSILFMGRVMNPKE